jgi:hypothetical protein
VTPLQIARLRCADMPLEDRRLFLMLFERGREDAELGADTEMTAWTLRGAALDAAVAGYLEGLASTRELPPLGDLVPGTDRRCGRGSYAGYQAHWRAGEPACAACLAANGRRSHDVRRRAVMA